MKTILRDDSAQTPGKNGKPALAGAIGSSIKVANQFSLRARPLFNWWGGNSDSSETAAAPQIMSRYLSRSLGHPDVYAFPLIVPVPDTVTPIAPTTPLIVDYRATGLPATQSTVPLAKNTKENINEPPSTWYPDFCQMASPWRVNFKDYSPGVATATPMTVRTGGPTSDIIGPQLRSGMIIEAEMLWGTPVIGKEVLATDGFTSGNDIIGGGGAGHYFNTTNRDLQGVRDFINSLYREKRIHFGWCMSPGTGTSGASGVLISSTNPTYILNTQYGSGGGLHIAPTITGPSIAIPLQFAAHGRNTTVRLYVSVYARMTGGGSGTLSYYGRDTSTFGLGALVGPTALTNGPTITGTTLQWWPSGTTWNPATWPYFPGSAIRASDRILLCGQSSGASSLEIVAFTITALAFG